MKGRRTHLKDWDRRLLRRLAQGTWTADELAWLRGHLADDTPTAVYDAIDGKLREQQGE